MGGGPIRCRGSVVNRGRLMIQLEVLVEEPSADDVLRHPLPKLLRGRARAKVVNLGSKYNLLKMLRDRLAAYRIRIDQDGARRIVVLVDQDARAQRLRRTGLPDHRVQCRAPAVFRHQESPLRRRQQAHRFLHAG